MLGVPPTASALKCERLLLLVTCSGPDRDWLPPGPITGHNHLICIC